MIAAWNAERFVASAVRSALDQPEAAEVILVDDASTDGTCAAARHAAGGDPRLQIVRLSRNVGPGAARNAALDRATAPIVALLDADDVFLPGRLARLIAAPDWDLIADNVLFAENLSVVRAPVAKPGANRTLALDAATFVAGNLRRLGKARAEFGFVKPLMRRAFLDHHGLRYDPAMRLGEDYDLYLRALVAGGRFRLSGSCGYVALIRSGSLSEAHAIDDLARLGTADAQILERSDLAPALRRALRRHERQVLRSVWLRQALRDKAAHGWLGAIGYLLSHPLRAPSVVLGGVLDKSAPLCERAWGGPVVGDARLLFDPTAFTEAAVDAQALLQRPALWQIVR